MNDDLDEFLDCVGVETTEPKHRRCMQKGCNKLVATMEEARAEKGTATCSHCFKIYLPRKGDKLPNVIKKAKEFAFGQEWDVNYYEDGSKKLIQKL